MAVEGRKLSSRQVLEIFRQVICLSMCLLVTNVFGATAAAGAADIVSHIG